MLEEERLGLEVGGCPLSKASTDMLMLPLSPPEESLEKLASTTANGSLADAFLEATAAGGERTPCK